MKIQLAVITAAWIILSGMSPAQTLHWTEVDEHVSSDIETFRQLFKNAHTTGFGITILGDSQETPGRANGRYYIPALGDQFYQHYGNVPKTAIVTELSQTAAWLSAGETAGELSSDAEYSLPSVNVKEYDAMPFENGLLAQAALDGYTTPYLNVPDAGYFNGHPLDVELIIRTRPNSAEAFWQATLVDDEGRSYLGGDPLGSGFTDVDADREQIEFVSAYLDTFEIEKHDVIQIIARSGEEDRTVDIAGVRFINSADSSGVAIQSLSKGGNSASQFLLEQDDAASLFKLLAGEDVVALQFGTNDAKAGTTAEEFKEDLRSIISNVRSWSGNDSLPIIIISDPDFDRLPLENKADFDLYPGVSAELATELENVLALNTRLIAHRNNWFVGSSDYELFSDGLHYTELGSAALAQWQVDSLLNLPYEQEIEGTSGDDWVIFDPVASEITVNGEIFPIDFGATAINFYGGGGIDHVTAIGDPEQDEFAILQGIKMTVRTDNYFFVAHDAVELEFESRSRSDTCVIFDSEAAEKLTSTTTSVRLQAEADDSLLQATNVRSVLVFSSGGDDSARMRGGLQSERIKGSMQNRMLRMVSTDFSISLLGFKKIHAIGGIGEIDVATIVESDEQDIVYFRGDYGRFLNNTIDYTLRGFERVNYSCASGSDVGVFQQTEDSRVAGNEFWKSLVGPAYRNNTFGLKFVQVREP